MMRFSWHDKARPHLDSTLLIDFKDGSNKSPAKACFIEPTLHSNSGFIADCWPDEAQLG
jgi:hypothetical protein